MTCPETFVNILCRFAQEGSPLGMFWSLWQATHPPSGSISHWNTFNWKTLACLGRPLTAHHKLGLSKLAAMWSIRDLELNGMVSCIIQCWLTMNIIVMHQQATTFTLYTFLHCRYSMAHWLQFLAVEMELLQSWHPFCLLASLVWLAVSMSDVQSSFQLKQQQ